MKNKSLEHFWNRERKSQKASTSSSPSSKDSPIDESVNKQGDKDPPHISSQEVNQSEQGENEQIDVDILPHDPGTRKPISSYPINDRDLIRRGFIDKGPCRPKPGTECRTGDMEGNVCIFIKDQQPNVKFGNEGILPEDVLVEILLRLAVRHLVRLKSVCKSWCALIDDINFIKRHHRVHYSICEADGDIPSICWQPKSVAMNRDLKVCLLSKQNGYVPLDLAPDFIRDSATSFTNAPTRVSDGVIVGIVNGVICIIWKYQDLGLWNPATREFKVITPWINSHVHTYGLCLVGFGFDCISNDFKILRGNCRADGTRSYEVYSLTTNSWKRIGGPPPLLRRNRLYFTVAYLNGVCYWAVDCDVMSSPLFLSFNFSTEVFEVFNHPLNAIGSEVGYEYVWTITVYKECLAFVVNRTNLGMAECNFDVWVLTEFQGNSGMPKSWQHLFKLGPFPLSYGLMLNRFRIDGDVLFRCLSIEEEFSVYNPSTGSFKNLGSIGRPFDYVESLFSLST